MYVCLIPPKGMEPRMMRGDMVMCLAQYASYGPYMRTVQEASAAGRHVIMDNGASEGEAVASKELLVLANKFGAHEIVLPDVLYDAPRTVQRVRSYIETTERLGESPRYMAVVQGSSKALTPGQLKHQLYRCVDAYAEMPGITSVGIPRNMIRRDCLSMRIDVANWMLCTYPQRFAIHFLGTSPLWPREVASAAKYTDVRSVDTSLPYNYAIYGYSLKKESLPPVSRPDDYFNVSRARVGLAPIFDDNEKEFKRWCKYVTPKPTA